MTDADISEKVWTALSLADVLTERDDEFDSLSEAMDYSGHSEPLEALTSALIQAIHDSDEDLPGRGITAGFVEPDANGWNSTAITFTAHPYRLCIGKRVEVDLSKMQATWNDANAIVFDLLDAIREVTKTQQQMEAVWGG